MTWFCSLYGLHIQSDIRLYGLSVGKAATETVDVTLRKGRCPLPHSVRDKDEHFDLERESALLFWKQFGGFWIRKGREVIIEPAQGVADDLLRPVLCGPVLAMLLFQRGFSVLHASATALRLPDGTERAIGFLGHSGQGKSTMATALHKRGHRALCDDTIAVPVPEAHSDNARPLIYPALPHLKLRPPSVAALGETLSSLTLWQPDHDSYVLPLAGNSLDPAPLHGLYYLEESDTLRIERMNPQEALMNVLEHSYCMRALPENSLGDDFLQCARLIQQIPVFRLQRPKDFSILPDVVRLLEEHQGV